MKPHFSDIIIKTIFLGLILAKVFIRPEIKSDAELFLLFLSLITLLSLLFRQPYTTSIVFYILLGIILFENIFFVVDMFVNTFTPDSGEVIESNGTRHRVMQMNWVWGVLCSLSLTPLIIFFYYKKKQQYKLLEIGLTVIFIIETAINYLKNEFR